MTVRSFKSGVLNLHNIHTKKEENPKLQQEKKRLINKYANYTIDCLLTHGVPFPYIDKYANYTIDCLLAHVATQGALPSLSKQLLIKEYVTNGTATL